ncbi:hypothetical protein COB57_06005 [Candidatus Peregrinibacteria bacterium]|nr:MAG: hypothetical protein COB57_06005 [Candidatus Peregrinibacteria bacterium]
MKISVKNLLQWWEQAKKQSFSHPISKKRAIITLQKIGVYTTIGIVALIIAIKSQFIDNQIKYSEKKSAIESLIFEIYGDDKIDGKKFEDTTLKGKVIAKSEKLLTEQENNIQKYEEALLRQEDPFYITNILEEYAITLNSQEKPIITTGITLGSAERITIKPEDFQQNMNITASKQVVEIILGEEFEKEWTQEFFQIEGDSVVFYNKLKITDFNTINTEFRNPLRNIWKKSVKISIPASYKIIPISVSLEAHPDKFEQFIKFIYHSGDIDNFLFKEKPVPIMSLESFTLPLKAPSFAPSTDADRTESYSVQIHAYFQASPQDTTKDTSKK